MMRLHTHALGLVAIALTALGIAACGPGTPPAGQPPMAVLTVDTLESLRLQFNQATGQTRVVLLLSPT